MTESKLRKCGSKEKKCLVPETAHAGKDRGDAMFVGGAHGYNFMGFDHNVETDEEEQLLSHLPNLNRYYPTTDEQTKGIMEEEYKREGPMFMRL